MGCISCKAITRSLSIREEVSHGFGGNSSAWDELLTSNGGNDHLFALLCSSNNVSKKLKTSSFTLPSIDPGPGDWITDVDGKVDELESGSSRFTRSKSCQISGEKDVLGLSSEINGNKKAIGSRSFHTVEEYDALLERIHKSSAESFEDYYSSNCADGNQESGEEKKRSIEEEVVDLDINSKDAPENGWKRKAVGRGLKSLEVEFPKQILLHDEAQHHSPGTYVTPKFGSYCNTDASATQQKTSFTAMFSPELVAAFEESMMELQVEEDNILRELDGY